MSKDSFNRTLGWKQFNDGNKGCLFIFIFVFCFFAFLCKPHASRKDRKTWSQWVCWFIIITIYLLLVVPYIVLPMMESFSRYILKFIHDYRIPHQDAPDWGIALLDQFMFLEKNGPPTPPLSQHFFLIETYVNVGLGEGFLIFRFSFLFFFYRRSY